MFRNDYSVLAHEDVLNLLIKYKDEENIGYGLDKHSLLAKNLILKAFNLNDSSDVFFVAGGTQANTVVISYFLRPYEAIISCNTGHINVHETGAVEGTGHKIYTVNNVDGKIKPEDIINAINKHTDEHMVKIKMVYISDSTESGTVYTKQELLDIRKVCDDNNLLLFIDGARLGIALTSQNSDVDASFIGKVADIFYVGGTKNGIMYGEAIVIKNKNIAPDFRYHIKNRCAMLSKGFAVAIQFEALFTNNLFFNLAKKANDLALLIKNNLHNVNFVGTSTTNQLFIKVNKELANKLIDKYGLELWESKDNSNVVRIVTSFANTIEEVNELIEFINGAING